MKTKYCLHMHLSHMLTIVHTVPPLFSALLFEGLLLALLQHVVPGKRGTGVNMYLGSLLNLCVTTADFPLHFSQEYSISSACFREHKND